MPNALTGEFDVVAQFAIPAANRVLAAMHRAERFPHSISMRVDDPPDRPWDDFRPTVIGIVDLNGDPVSNHQRIGRPSLAAVSAVANAAFSRFDPVVNFPDAVLEVIPSDLQGRVQLQLFPPTMEVTDASGNNVTVRIGLIARYFPDPNTSPVAEFVRGEVRIIAPVNQVTSQDVSVVEIDIKSANIGIDFRVDWSSSPLSTEDIKAVNRLIRNALKTSFLPSSNPLPSGIKHMQFRTLSSPRPAVAVLLNMDEPAGNRASATNVFLGGEDFAFGVGVDFVKRAFQPTLDKILSTPVDPAKFTISGLVHTWHITYTFTLKSASVELKNGEIVLIVKGHARTGSWTPNFDFTAKLSFSVEVSGDTADLVAGDVSIDTSSWIIDRFRGKATSVIRGARDAALNQAGVRDTIRRMLSAEGNLGGLLDSLLQPPRKANTPPAPKGFSLAYSSAEILTTGIILRGLMSVSPWPAVHVAFEQIPMDGGGRFDAGVNDAMRGPDYSALKSWIPGGTINRYEWKSLGQIQPGFIDDHRFVLLHQPPEASEGFMAARPLSGYAPLCLTVQGSRLSATGPVVAETVMASVCNIKSFPVGELVGADGNLTIALARPGRDGRVDIVGDTRPQASERGRSTPNLVVHFGDEQSSSHLDTLVDGLSDSGRSDASTAILAVLSERDLHNARYTEGITFAEDKEDSWARRFDVTGARRPLTLVVTPKGEVVWKHEGAVDRAKLAEVLRKTLVPGGKVEATFRPMGLRIGQPPPNFHLQLAAGQNITLRKLTGREIALVFWRSTSKQSVELLHEMQKSASGRDRGGPLVIGINDGEPANRANDTEKGSPINVPDPSRHISNAYGISTWPTTIWIDKLGAVGAVRLGTLGGDASRSPFEQSGQASQSENVPEQRSAGS